MNRHGMNVRKDMIETTGSCCTGFFFFCFPEKFVLMFGYIDGLLALGYLKGLKERERDQR